MNEKEMMELLNSVDNDLIEKELEDLMKDIDIDMPSITAKAYAKLNNRMSEQPHIRESSFRKRLIPVAVAAVVIVGISSVYASELSDFVKSFMNKTEIYETVTDGKGFYLNSPVQLDDGHSLDMVFFTSDRFEMNLTYPLASDTLPDIKGVTKNGDVYTPGGYGYDEDKGLMLSFINMAEKNYSFAPTQEIELIIDGKSYDISLSESVSVLAKGEIVPPVQYTDAEPDESMMSDPDIKTESDTQAERITADWVNIGYKKTDDGIMIVTSFDDTELKLGDVGVPGTDVNTHKFINEGSSTISSGMSSMIGPLLGYDEDQNEYKYSIDENATGRPITKFISDVPDGKKIRLELPGIMVQYEKLINSFSIEIPELNETVFVNKEIDLKLQKMVCQSITRTSETSAQIIFKLNTGDKKETSIWYVGMQNLDLLTGESVFKDGYCTFDITFDKDLTNTDIELVWPEFVVRGDWTFEIE